ncbi:MAG: hypothetical protein KGI94_06300 [Paracoccaceae bacterium]|nr:hypothetical protein [Paracoccaceae bacterium]
MNRHAFRKRAIGATAFCAVAGLAVAQTLPQPGDSTQAGTLLHFGLQSSLRHDSNLDLAHTSPGSSTILDNTLSVGMTSVTRQSSFLLDLSGILRAASTPASVRDASFDGQKVKLGYKRIGPSSSFELGGSYDRISLQFLDPLSQTMLNGTDLVPTKGTRRQFQANAQYTLGADGPYGLTLEARTFGRRYDGAGSQFYDSTNTRVTATGRMELNKDNALLLSLMSGNYAARDSNATHERQQSVALTFGHNIDKDNQLKLTVGLLRQKIDSLTSTSNRTRPLFTVVYAHSNGSATQTATLDHRLTPSGNRDTLTFQHRTDLPTGLLSFMIGASRTEGRSAQAIGALDYVLDGPRGRFSVRLSRSVSSPWDLTGLDTQEELLTRAAASYRVHVNELTGLRFTVDFARSDPGNSSGGNSTQASNVTAAYERALTRDWQLSAGLTHRNRRDPVSGAAAGNAVFLTLARSFSIRP